MEKDFTEHTLSQNYVYRGRILCTRVDEVELPSGAKASREVIEHVGGVCVAALTPQEELLFVRQYRYPYGETLLELPAGKLEKGEDPLEAGKRELREETGAVGKAYRSLGVMYPSPGFCDEVLHLYACDVERMEEMCPDEDEFLQMQRIPLAEAEKMALSGEIPDAKTQVLVLKVAALRRDKKRGNLL